MHINQNLANICPYWKLLCCGNINIRTKALTRDEPLLATFQSYKHLTLLFGLIVTSIVWPKFQMFPLTQWLCKHPCDQTRSIVPSHDLSPQGPLSWLLHDNHPPGPTTCAVQGTCLQTSLAEECRHRDYHMFQHTPSFSPIIWTVSWKFFVYPDLHFKKTYLFWKAFII